MAKNRIFFGHLATPVYYYDFAENQFVALLRHQLNVRNNLEVIVERKLSNLE